MLINYLVIWPCFFILKESKYLFIDLIIDLFINLFIYLFSY